MCWKIFVWKKYRKCVQLIHKKPSVDTFLWQTGIIHTQFLFKRLPPWLPSVSTAVYNFTNKSMEQGWDTLSISYHYMLMMPVLFCFITMYKMKSEFYFVVQIKEGTDLLYCLMSYNNSYTNYAKHRTGCANYGSVVGEIKCNCFTDWHVL